MLLVREPFLTAPRGGDARASHSYRSSFAKSDPAPGHSETAVKPAWLGNCCKSEKRRTRERRHSWNFVLGADKQEIDEVRILAVTGRCAEGYVVEQHLNIAALIFVHLKGNVRKLGLIAYVERGVQAQAQVSAGRQVNFGFRQNGEGAIDD